MLDDDKIAGSLSRLSLPVLAILFSTGLAGCASRGHPAPQPPAPTTLKSAAAARGITVGTAVSSRRLADPALADILQSEFSQLEPENEMKFALIHPRANTDPQPYNFTGADALVSFARAHGLLVRGHTLVWHKQLPNWVLKGTYTETELAAILRDHITTVVGHYQSDVYAWDVVNEAFNDDGSLRDTIWYNKPGIGSANEGTKYIEQAFRWARAANQNARLFYNDYDAEPINPKSNAIYAMAADFKKRGVPLDGVGFQVHLDPAFNNPAMLDSFRKNLQRFADLGLEIHFTELDVRLKDGNPGSLEAQAQLYAEVVKTCLALRACKMVQSWGITDRYSWIPGWYSGQGWALPWDANYNPKPAYFAMRDAFLSAPIRKASR